MSKQGHKCFKTSSQTSWHLILTFAVIKNHLDMNAPEQLKSQRKNFNNNWFKINRTYFRPIRYDVTAGKISG